MNEIKKNLLISENSIKGGLDNDKIDEICALLPGMKSPSILPLRNSNWSSLHSVVQEQAFWGIIDQLKAAGAEGILVIPIEKMIV